MKTASERKAEERARRRSEGLRPFEVWANPKDWPLIKRLVERLAKRRKTKCEMNESPEKHCTDCEESTTWSYAVQHDPWGRATGDVLCENCAEGRWVRQQERALESA